ncbi:penicillin-binding protein [Antarcticibacterium flavum]|uniref:Penicillin-binding protein n=1 Tax=Antarcticibacterium flavum TaxID=2058175 RepID=A0A5B7WYL2_9FLAO|nr:MULTISPECIES: transglycosylase domain-containing protein [Antarcticibacterium]MCM4158957.1 penicillin-binding protein [Antarcticibacterium sp. W02-3]QCY68209.1 penicillin-binding protein [Antarcticibacterium flavum]
MLKRIKESPRLKWVAGIFLGVLSIFLLFYLSIYFGLFGKIPNSSQLKELKQNEATQVLSSTGELIGKYYIFDRQPITYDQLPQHLIDALIATEDVRFYEHDGIDNRSLLRVFFKTLLLQDRSSGGGSTISLQLAKNLYGRKDFGPLGIVVNKVQEAIIAKRLEDIYSKKEILTLYLNTVPFSDNTFGIEAAAVKFFDKHASELELEEAAVLVGMLKASHYFNPRIFPERSRLRRDVVLVQMEKYGYLTPQRAEEAKLKELQLTYQGYSHDQGLAPYFREQLRKDLVAILDTLPNKNGDKYNIYKDGLIVHTTLDHQMQEIAEEAMRTHMSKLQEAHERSYGNSGPWKNENLLLEAVKKTEHYKRLQKEGLEDREILERLDREEREIELFNYGEDLVIKGTTLDSIAHYLKFLNAGFLAVEPTTGAVKTWVGGIDFEHFKYDHVSQSKRQVGSTFKPIVYTAALESGMEPCTYFSLNEVTYKGGWTPGNSGQPEEDPYINYNLQTALSRSINTIAVKVLMQTGISNVLKQARKMGITTELPAVPSIALGTAELSLREVAKAYTTYLNSGKPSTPYYITRIEDGRGNLLAEFEPQNNSAPAFSNTNRQVMLEMMKSTVNEGTAVRLRTIYGLKNDIAGKTGTTQSNKDGWFVGLLPNLVTVTWVGADDHRIGFRSTSIGQGANSALPIFALFLQELNSQEEYKEITSSRFTAPSATVVSSLDCEPEKRDGFFKRLFTNPDKPQKEEKKEKKGFFKRLFGKKDKN